jgi:hypothetical protein
MNAAAKAEPGSSYTNRLAPSPPWDSVHQEALHVEGG